MILIVHNIKKVKRVRDITNHLLLDFNANASVAEIVLDVAKANSNQWIIWANEDVENAIAFSNFKTVFHHDAIMASYSTSGSYTISNTIGYVEQSPFINVKQNVSYPTWLMSSTIGGAKGMVLQKFEYLRLSKFSFPLFLNHISKQAQKQGILCYSDHRLLKENAQVVEEPKSNIFRFVKQHYKLRWLFLLFFNLIIYEKKWRTVALCSALFSKSYKNLSANLLEDINIQSSRKLPEFTIDVIIPTVGRKTYLKNVLLDLSKQTVLPQSVIIVEQRQDGISELDYLKDNWPFKIVHRCIDQFGACNARNLALQEVTANWVFLADDDNELKENLLENIKNQIYKYGSQCITTSYLQKDEIEVVKENIQWHAFGAGNSIIDAQLLKQVKFDEAHEFGYGEDVDFGMQLRNLGVDVVYFPNIKILHLKAPIGGFRTKVKFPWNKDKFLPKPSPMVMAFKLKHYTKQQLLGYKTTLFLKFYKRQQIKNPLKYILRMQKQWQTSITWANKRILESNE